MHNLVYGGVPAFLPQTPRLPVNFPLPPGQLLETLRSRDAEGVLREQIAGVLVLPEVSAAATVPVDYLTAVRVVQAAWLLALVWVMVARVRRERLLIPMLVPVAFLAPHVLFQVYVYYPRHVVIGYLAAALAVLAVVSDAVAGAPGRAGGPKP